ncbi:MAG: hypothetical protein LBK94_01750 [Prevotellaceae bacterium]|jgi:uncharacterized membrane protein YfcA|nr:hypothetical protein [Prevotellaceae bacterium]
MTWKIIQLLISIGLIIGGLSGEFVLRGTDSSGLLVVFGCIWLIYDIYSIYAYKKARSDIQKAEEESLANESVKIENPCTVSLTRKKNIIGCAVGIRVFLNGAEQGVLKNGKTIIMQTELLHNVLVVKYNADDKTNTVRFDASPGSNVNITLQYLNAKLTIEK